MVTINAFHRDRDTTMVVHICFITVIYRLLHPSFIAWVVHVDFLKLKRKKDSGWTTNKIRCYKYTDNYHKHMVIQNN